MHAFEGPLAEKHYKMFKNASPCVFFLVRLSVPDKRKCQSLRARYYNTNTCERILLIYNIPLSQ